MNFLPYEMHMIQNALNEICNGVEIPEFELKLGKRKEEYQCLLNKVATFYGWQIVVMENWNRFDPIGVYQDDEGPEDPYEYSQYVNPTIHLILKKESFDAIKAYIVDVLQNNIGILPDDELIDDFVRNIIALQSKIEYIF